MRLELSRTDSVDSVATAVIDAIADIEGVAPTELSICLADYLDGEALEALFAHDTREPVAMELWTTVGPYEVHISSDGVVATDPCSHPKECRSPKHE